MIFSEQKNFAFFEGVFLDIFFLHVIKWKKFVTL